MHYNPRGYLRSIHAFLNMNDRDLDYGFLLQLKKEAHAKGNWDSQVRFMTSSVAQGDVDEFVLRTFATSLAVERKQNLDNNSTGASAKTVTLASASRNGIWQTHRITRNRQLAVKEAALKRWKKLRCMNPRAIAVQRNPELLPRPRGKLHWESDVAPERQQQCCHTGDARALALYLETHQEELKAEAEALKSQAAVAKQIAESVELPCTNREWLEYWAHFLGMRSAFWRSLPATSISSARARAASGSKCDMSRRNKRCQHATWSLFPQRGLQRESQAMNTECIWGH